MKMEKVEKMEKMEKNGKKWEKNPPGKKHASPMPSILLFPSPIPPPFPPLLRTSIDGAGKLQSELALHPWTVRLFSGRLAASTVVSTPTFVPPAVDCEVGQRCAVTITDAVRLLPAPQGASPPHTQVS